MTRTHAAKRLLEHGPLSFGDFMSITGWRETIASSALDRLMKRGAVSIKNMDGKRHYFLAVA